jgi:hypothetical protein
MGRACNMYWGEDELIRDLGRKGRKKETTRKTKM